MTTSSCVARVLRLPLRLLAVLHRFPLTAQPQLRRRLLQLRQPALITRYRPHLLSPHSNKSKLNSQLDKLPSRSKCKR